MKYLYLLIFCFLIGCTTRDGKVTQVIFVSAQNECIANDGLKYLNISQVIMDNQRHLHSRVQVTCNNDMSKEIIVVEPDS